MQHIHEKVFMINKKDINEDILPLVHVCRLSDAIRRLPGAQPLLARELPITGSLMVRLSVPLLRH